MLSAAAVEFEIPYENGRVYYITIDDEDMFAGDNSCFVVTTENESTEAFAMIDSLSYSEDTVSAEVSLFGIDTDAAAYLAIYDNGTLISAGKKGIAANSEKVSIDANADLSVEKSYTVKVFVWDKNMTPLTDNCSGEVYCSK